MEEEVLPYCSGGPSLVLVDGCDGDDAADAAADAASVMRERRSFMLVLSW